jgi:hypothetical protein
MVILMYIFSGILKNKSNDFHPIRDEVHFILFWFLFQRIYLYSLLYYILAVLLGSKCSVILHTTRFLKSIQILP